MSTTRRTAALALIPFFFCSASAVSAPVEVSFQAQNFTGNLGGAVPQDPVTGSFVLEHDGGLDFTGQALNPVLSAIDLTIDGHTYSIADTELNSYVALADGLVSFVQLGGTINGFGTTVGGTEDFNLVLTATDFAAPSRMRYSVDGVGDLYLATNSEENLSDVTFQSAVIPVPPAMWLIASAVAFLVPRVRRRPAC